MLSQSITLLGVGWLGEALAHHLKALGYELEIGVRSPERAAALAAWSPQLFAVTHPPQAWPFRGNTLIITLPPQEDYVAKLTALGQQAQQAGVERIIFTSSIGVWGQGQAEDARPQPTTARGELLLAAEEALRGKVPYYYVLRLGGLYGGQRHPGRFFKPGHTATGGAQSVNLVHRADVIAAIELLLTQTAPELTFNLVAPGHPTKAVFYPAAQAALGLGAVEFVPPQGAYLPITGQAIEAALGFTYRYPDPAKWLELRALDPDFA